MSMSMESGDSRPTLLSVKDVLSELQIGKSFFYNLTRSGKGPTLTKLGDRTFVSRENLANWLKTRELRKEVGRAAA